MNLKELEKYKFKSYPLMEGKVIEGGYEFTIHGDQEWLEELKKKLEVID